MKKTTIKTIKKLSREELPLPNTKIVPDKKKEKLDKIKKQDAND